MKQDEGYTSEKHYRSQQIADKYRKSAAKRAGRVTGGNSVSGLGVSRRKTRKKSITPADILADLLSDRRVVIAAAIIAALLLIFIFTRIFGGGSKPVETEPETTTTEAPVETTTEEETEPPLGSYYDAHQPAVALTFSDGPSEGTTDAILDILEQYGAHATFFMVGQNVANNPGAVKRMVELHCELGNHTWNHKQLTDMDASEREADFLKTNQTIKEASGGTPVTVIRPPYGATNKEIRDELQIPIVIWSLDTQDQESRNAQSIISAVRTQVKGGDIIQLHDDQQATVDAVKEIVPMLLQQGYKLLTVTELYEYYGEPFTLHLGHAYAEPQPQAATSASSSGLSIGAPAVDSGTAATTAASDSLE